MYELIHYIPQKITFFFFFLFFFCFFLFFILILSFTLTTFSNDVNVHYIPQKNVVFFFFFFFFFILILSVTLATFSNDVDVFCDITSFKLVARRNGLVKETFLYSRSKYFLLGIICYVYRRNY